MKLLETGIAVLVFVAGLSVAVAGQSDNPQPVCESRSTRVRATEVSVRATAVTFNSNPLVFDPVPLISTKVHVGGRGASCLIAHFSAMVGPMDNHVVFQARVDDVPMAGHLPGFVGIGIPVVTEPDYTDVVLSILGVTGGRFEDIPQRMIAYNFFRTVKPGDHTVEVLFAGCCSSNPLGSGAVVNRAVLTLEFLGGGLTP